MSLFAIVLIILLGVVLLIVEFLILPGITVAGIGGVILIGVGVYLTYDIHGTVAGNYMLLGSFLMMILTLAYALRERTWKRTMLESKMEGRAYVYDKTKVQKGDTGKTVTRLGPFGKAMVNDQYLDARSVEGIIGANEPIEVVKIESNKIIVKPLNK